MRGLLSVILLFLLFSSQGSISSKSLWRDRNIYTAAANLRVGDIIIVVINDISSLRYNISINSDNSFTLVSNPDREITSFLPKASTNRKMNNSGKTDISGQSNLNFSIPSTITKRLKNGKMEIAGTRQYSFNGITSSFTVSGIVDPMLIMGRAVHSGDVASFRLNIRRAMKGADITIKRAKLKKDETARVKLTEDEKQKIIVDYLQKIINQLLLP